jgi:hypothetical protein
MNHSKINLKKFFLLWFLAILMGECLIEMHFGLESSHYAILLIWIVVSGVGIRIAMLQPRWQKISCSWCGSALLEETSSQYIAHQNMIVTQWKCQKCGQSIKRVQSKRF